MVGGQTLRMHEGEADIESTVVRRLLEVQFPELAQLPIRPVESMGTVNVIFRLGDDLCVRLPRLEEGDWSLEREWTWLPRLAPHLPLGIPKPVAMGHPTSWYPFCWAIYQWIDGAPYADDLVDDECDVARDLGRFVAAMRSMERAKDAPRAGRRPLRELDDVTRKAIKAANDVIDADAALAAWERALEAPAWDGTAVWIHANLLRPNLLIREGRLSAVIDFGSVGVGDPATDIIPAWSVFGPNGREVFRNELDVDDDTWNRARGIALHQAALIIPYYRLTNPGFVELAERTVKEIIMDL